MAVGPARQHGGGDPARADDPVNPCRGDRLPVPDVPLRPAPADRHAGAVVDGVFEQDATGSGTRKPARPALPTVTDSLERLGAGLERMPEMLGHGKGIGSNAWAVDGERSTTGEPILANDPHLGTSMPGIWYQMGLHCTPSSASLPVRHHRVHLRRGPGRGDRPQPADRLGLHQPRPRRGRPVPGEARRQALRVRRPQASARHPRGDHRGPRRGRAVHVHGALHQARPAALRRVGAAEHGRRERPRPGTGPERGNGYAVALSWTALTPNRTADAIFEIDKATNWDEFRAATGTSPRRRRTWSTPTGPATSDTRRPG